MPGEGEDLVRNFSTRPTSSEYDRNSITITSIINILKEKQSKIVCHNTVNNRQYVCKTDTVRALHENPLDSVLKPSRKSYSRENDNVKCAQ